MNYKFHVTLLMTCSFSILNAMENANGNTTTLQAVSVRITVPNQANSNQINLVPFQNSITVEIEPASQAASLPSLLQNANPQPVLTPAQRRKKRVPIAVCCGLITIGILVPTIISAVQDPSGGV